MAPGAVNGRVDPVLILQLLAEGELVLFLHRFGVAHGGDLVVGPQVQLGLADRLPTAMSEALQVPSVVAGIDGKLWRA